MPAHSVVTRSAILARRNALFDLALAGRISSDTGLMLASGGDSRIDIAPLSGRNRYGTCTSPALDEVSFASTTANNATPAGFAAASGALDRLLAATQIDRLGFEAWFDEIRERITHHLGIPGAATVLAASGTDAEVIALALSAGLTDRPLTNILIAPDETGSGVPMAAAGCHFLDRTALGGSVKAGTPIDEALAGRTLVRSFAIRAADGSPRPQDVVDAEVAEVVSEELARSRDVLVHVLDTSKTGLSGLSRAAARRLLACSPGRVRILVDACQLRCSFDAIRQDLVDGFMVVATGSKFAGGPPFSGALLLPPPLAVEAAQGRKLPPGLRQYSAALDWPPALRAKFGQELSVDANIGLGLRWVAALSSIDAIAGMSPLLRQAITDRFAVAVCERANGLRFVAPPPTITRPASSIIALDVLDRTGEPMPFEAVQRLHLGLRDDPRGPVCHIGQPVSLGNRTVLRLALSANDLAAVAERLSRQTLNEAVRPLEDALDTVFEKWMRLADA